MAPATLPIGMPTTNARVIPPDTIARAEPRRSGGTSEAAATLAAGPAMAPATPARARTTISVSKFGAKAQASCRTSPIISPRITTNRRSSRPSTQATIGPSTAEVST
jgi:hypothetical protein